MNKKLKDDYIKFTLSLNTSEAREELNRLNASSRELQRTNDGLRNSMTELVASGKKGSDEYKRLEAELKSNSKAISDNNAKVKILRSSMKSTEKTYAELAKEARGLQKQLDNTVKSLHPEEYARLEKQLEETREAMARLRGGTNETSGSFLKLGNMKAMVVGFFVSAGAAALDFLKDGISKAKEFVRESVEVAIQADGVLHAFEKLDRPDLLANLRTATKGTLSDLELMKATVKAKDFRIPVDDMGKYLAFAQLKAQQTGQSVEYMTDSIVTGLGRKSLLILDNLGLSAAEINEEVAKTGDFMKGVSNIIDRQLTQSGLYVSASDKAAQADARLENAKLRLGRRLSWLGDLWISLKNKMAETVNTTVSTANEKFYEQKERVVSLYSEYMPLLDRYDELKTKTKLSSDEQAELNTIITKITDNIPGVITKVGEYGQALDISSGKAREFVRQQKVLLEYMNREAIKEEEDNLKEYRRKYQNALKAQQAGGVYVTSSMSNTGYSTSYFDNTPGTLECIDDDVRRYGDMIKGAELRIRELRGESLEKSLEDNEKRIKMRDEFIKMNKKQLETWLADEKNADSQYRDMAATILSGKSEIQADPKKVSQQNAVNAQSVKLEDLRKKHLQERQRQEEELEYRVAQSRIDAMEAGAEKELAQRELNNRREISLLQRQKGDYIQAVIQFEKEKFEAEEELKAKKDKRYVKKSFDSSSVSVDTSTFDTIISNTTRRQRKEGLREQESSWDEYLIKYGTFQGKKEALTRKYRALMDSESDAGRIAFLQKEFEEALSALDVDKLKQEINWEMIFGDLSKVSKKELDKVRTQLKLFRESDEYKNMTVEQKKVIDEALDGIQSAIIDKGGLLGDLPDQLDNLRKAQEELDKAQDEYNASLESGTRAEQEAAKEKLNTADQNVTNAKTNVDKSSKKAIDNITGVTNAIVQLGEADMSLSSFGESVGSLVDVLSESGSKIGGIIAAILAILDQIGDQGLDKFVGNILETVSNAVGGIFDTVGSIFGIKGAGGIFHGADYSGYNEMVAQYENLLDIWDELLDKKKAYINESYGAEASKAGEEALNIAKNELEVQKKLAEARLSAGSSIGSHSQGYRMWKGSYKWEGQNWRDVAGEISREYGVTFNEMKDMINMSPEILQSIRENYAGLWSVMDGEFRNHLENIIKYGETEKEILEAVKEQITGISFDSFEDSYWEMISDLENGNEELAENLEEQLRKSIIRAMMADKYKEQVRKLYETWAEYGEDGYTKDEVDALREMQKQLSEAVLAERDSLADIFGWSASGDSYSQSSSTGYTTTMSQETGEEISGRLTAMYESNVRLETKGTEMNANMLIISTAALNMAKELATHSVCVTEMRDVLHECNGHLEKIEKYTGILSGMDDTLAEIEKNTKGM